MKIRSSLAKKALLELQQKNQVRLVERHHAQWIYTRTTAAAEAAEAEVEEEAKTTKKGKK